MTRPLRVAVICPYSLSVDGGVQLQALGLARALRELGVDARVLAPSDGPPPEPGIVSLGGTRGFPSNGSIAPISTSKVVTGRTLEALRSFRPDVVHLQEPMSPGANYAALIATDIPAVGTFHAAFPGRNGWYDAFRLPLRKMIERLSIRTAVSSEAQRNIETTFGVECEILPNGVDVKVFADAEPWPAPRPAVLFVGRHEPRKGLGVLLDAFVGLGDDRRLSAQPELWVAGQGPQTEELRARRVPSVQWLGRIPESEKRRRLRAATVACFPSTEGESFGVVLLEAMAAGTAIVASDLSGYREVARVDREALLVEPGDPTALRAVLARALADPDLRSGLVAEGRERAAEFSMAHLAAEFADRYESIATNRVPGRAAGRAGPDAGAVL
jgi:phosphatidylinositol alpha-mannosyltransferase